MTVYEFSPGIPSFLDVINNPDRTMGHAFVLAMLLTGELDEAEVRAHYRGDVKRLHLAGGEL